MFILSVLAEVAGSAEDKKDHSFPETLLVVHPLLGMGVPIGKVIKVPSSQPSQECQEKATDQEGQEGVLGWRSICQSSRTKRQKML